DTLIGGWDVGVRAEDGGDAAIEGAAPELHFARGFGMEIEDADAYVAGDGSQDAVGGLPWAVDPLHEKLGEETGELHARAVPRGHNSPIAAYRFGRKVRGFDNVCFALQY